MQTLLTKPTLPFQPRATRVLSILAIVVSIVMTVDCGPGNDENTPLPLPPEHPKLAQDGYAWWMLLRSTELPPGWTEQERYEPTMSNDTMKCLSGEPAGRTGYAETGLFVPPNQEPSILPETGQESAWEDVSVFDTPGDADAYLTTLSNQWRCTTHVINTLNADAYGRYYDTASLSDLHIVQPDSHVLGERSSYYEFESLPIDSNQPLAPQRPANSPAVQVNEDRVALARDNVVIVVYHRLTCSVPDFALTQYFVSKAYGKIGLHPPPAGTAVPPATSLSDVAGQQKAGP